MSARDPLPDQSGVGRLSRREMFDALPAHVQAELPTWPLPTYVEVKFVYLRWRDPDALDQSHAKTEDRNG